MVIHGLETFEGNHELSENEVRVAGKTYSVYIGKRVSLAHQSQVHGPARVGDDPFVGMHAPIFRTGLGDHVVVEPDAKLIDVKVASGRYVPALTLVTTQKQADALPLITPAYRYRNLNAGIVSVNMQLAKGGTTETDRTLTGYLLPSVEPTEAGLGGTTASGSRNSAPDAWIIQRTRSISFCWT